MRQVLQTKSSGMTLVRDVPRPPCPPGSVLVHNAFSVISAGTERARVELSQRSLLGKARERPDLVREVLKRARREGLRATRSTVQRKLNEEAPGGYSSAGVVLEVGEHVRGFNPGDRVACSGGGHANHAEVVSVPANLCARVPDAVPLTVAAFGSIAAIALHAVRLAEVQLAHRVAVVGCGLVGQLALRLVRAAGAETFALDIDQARVDQASASGADHALLIGAATAEEVLARTDQIGADAVLVTAAAPTSDPLVLGAKLARDRGTLVLVGAVPIDFPRAPLYDKELTFRVSRSYGPGRYDLDYEERGLDYPIGFVRWTEKRNVESFLQLHASGKIEVSDLVDQIVPVDDAAKAYDLLTASGPERPLGGILLSYGDAEPSLVSPAESRDESNEAHTAHVGGVRRKRRLETSEPRLGLIGPGGFAARILVPAFASAGVRLEAVAGGSGPSAEAAVRTLGFARTAESPDALIQDPEVEIVAISTRHNSHAELAVSALAAGKHVFCEKPLALTETELDEVLLAERESPGVLAVGFNRRFSPLLQQLRAECTNRPLAATYRVSAGRLPVDHWTHDLNQGGGRVLGEGCHFVDSLAYLADSPIDEVHAFGYGAPSLPLQSRDNLVIGLRLENGSVGSIAYVSDGSGEVGKERLEVFCGQRTLVLDDYQRLDVYGGNAKATTASRVQDKGHRAEIARFVTGVREGVNPVEMAVVRNVSLATLAIVESLRTGLAIRLV